MMKHMRGWAFPIGLLTLWMIAVAYTIYAISGMETAVRSADLSAIAVMQTQTTASPAHTS